MTLYRVQLIVEYIDDALIEADSAEEAARIVESEGFNAFEAVEYNLDDNPYIRVARSVHGVPLITEEAS